MYGEGYAARARAVRETATRCWICGEGARPDDPWQADHVLPAADYGGVGPLAPAHRSCNIRRGILRRANNPTDPALDRLMGRGRVAHHRRRQP